MTALTLLMLFAPAASAHTELVSSSPADGAQLTGAPGLITLTFDEAVSARLTTVSLRVDGREIGRLDTLQEAPDTVAGRVEPTQLANLTGAGTWQVSYRVAGDDGHPVTGDLLFEVDLGTAGTPTPTVSATPDRSPSASPAGRPPDPQASAGSDASARFSTLMLGLITAVGVAIGCVLLVRARRRSGGT